MPLVYDVFPSKYAKADELGGKAFTFRIKSWVKENMPNMQGKREDKIVLFLDGPKKGIILSRRTAMQITEAVEDAEMDNWPGKSVTVYPDQLKAFGKVHTVFCFRKADNGLDEPPAELLEDPISDDDFSDEQLEQDELFPMDEPTTVYPD